MGNCIAFNEIRSCVVGILPSERTFSSSYEIQGDDLGGGNFGSTYRCVDRVTRQQYTVKRINIKNLSSEAVRETDTEVKICTRLDHTNIIKLYESFHERDWRYIVFDFVEGRTLVDGVISRREHSESIVRRYMHQLLSAIQYCHRFDIVHRDVQPMNILIQLLDYKVVLTGFESAKGTRGVAKSFFGIVGCPWYQAPEMSRRDPYGKPVDLWACGIILYNLLGGIPPFSKGKGLRRDKPFQFPSPEFIGISQIAINLVNDLTTTDQNNRLTAGQALNHPFIVEAESSSTTHRQFTVDRLRILHCDLLMRCIEPSSQQSEGNVAK